MWKQIEKWYTTRVWGNERWERSAQLWAHTTIWFPGLVLIWCRLWTQKTSRCSTRSSLTKKRGARAAYRRRLFKIYWKRARLEARYKVVDLINSYIRMRKIVKISRKLQAQQRTWIQHLFTFKPTPLNNKVNSAGGQQVRPQSTSSSSHLIEKWCRITMNDWTELRPNVSIPSRH